MRYTGIRCEACGAAFAEGDDTVVCPVCGAPHHRACWNKAGCCAHEAAHAGGYVWIMPAEQQAGPQKPEEQNRDETDGDTMENGEKIVSCPRCGARNFQNDAYCLSCGQSLHGQQTAGTDRFGEDEGFSGRRIPEEILANFRKYGGLHPESQLDGIPVCEYSDYVGGGNPGKILRKISTMERYGKQISFLFPALLFGPIWFLFRKLRREGWIVGLALILTFLASGLLQINDAYVTYVKSFSAYLSETVAQMETGNYSVQDLQKLRQDMMQEQEALLETYRNAELSNTDRFKQAVSNALYYGAQIFIPLYCAIFAMKHFRRKAKEDILQIREECSDMSTYQQTLKKEGGTSVGGAAIGVLIVLTAFACQAYVPLLFALLYY